MLQNYDELCWSYAPDPTEINYIIYVLLDNIYSGSFNWFF